MGPDDFYLVYGDNSTSFVDTPTSGRIYVWVEREEGYVVLGDFDVNLNGSTLLGSSRTLYGAKAVYHSKKMIAKGEAKFEAMAYEAQPDTLPQRNVLRGIGGLAYFLIRIRSEFWIANQLLPGPIILSTTCRGNYSFLAAKFIQLWDRAVNSGKANLNLVVQYEYTPP